MSRKKIPSAIAKDDESRCVVLRDLGYLSEEDVCQLADVTATTVRTWRARRVGPEFSRVGRTALYHRDDVLNWLKRHKEATGMDAGRLEKRDRRVPASSRLD